MALRRFGWPAAGVGGAVLAVSALAASLWLPALPRQGLLGADYAFFLPNLLAGTFWHLANPVWTVPTFTPAQCGGFALGADPQGLYLSITQFLAFWMSPVAAVRASFAAYAVAGGLGAAWLARSGFGLSHWAAALAGALFTLNEFFAVRLAVGHLGFAPFMLTPVLAACALGPVRAWPNETLRVAGAATVLAIQIEGGMAALLAPCLLSAAIVLAMANLATPAAAWRPALRLASCIALGACASGAKLVAAAALLSHLPRDAYALPGFDNLFVSGSVALRSLFLFAWPDMPAALHHGGPVRPFLHEFVYGVGPAPLLLMAGWAWLAARSGLAWPGWGRGARWVWLLALLLVPLALNSWGPHWSAFLKTLPVLRQSTLLLRWFAAFILPACLGGAIAFDRLCALAVPPAILFAGGVALTVAALTVTVGGGASFVGQYDPAPVQAAWRGAMEAGAPPPVTRVAPGPGPAENVAGWLAGQNAIARGASAENCYQPLFGYALELFPRGTLHPGPIGDVREGRLNLKNPACYVFPGVNDCRPGDAFAEGRAADALAFASWHGFAWAEPGWARLAGWLGVLTASGLAAAANAACAAMALRRRA